MSGDDLKGAVAPNMVTALIEDLARTDPQLKQRLTVSIMRAFENVPEQWKQDQLQLIIPRLRD